MANTMRGAGDAIAAGLESIGITKERADRWAQAVGLSGCGCEARQAWFNALIPFRTTEHPQVVAATRHGACAERTEGLDEILFAAECDPCDGRLCVQVPGDTEQELWREVSASALVASCFLAMPGETVDPEKTFDLLRQNGFRSERVNTNEPFPVERDKMRHLFAMFSLPDASLCWRTLYRNVF
jgi:hypothetical protein